MSEAPPPHRPSRLVAAARWTLAWMFRLLTRPGRRAAAHVLTWLWFDIIRFRRRLIIDNLAIAFPDWSEAKRRDVGRKSVWHLCYSGAETFILPFFKKEDLATEVIFHGLENRDRALAAGKGILLLVPHIGNVEKLMAAGSMDGMLTSVIAKKFRSPFFTELVYGTRESFGTKFIDPHGPRTAFEILHALRRGEYVAFVLDQFTHKTFGVETTFFGRKVTTAYGLALFALKSGAPVLPTFGYRDEHDRLNFRFGEILPLDAQPDRDRTLLATTQRYSHCIEDMIRQQPEQWMWVHKRWKPIR